MKTCLPLFLALTIAALGCKSKPDEQREDNAYAMMAVPPEKVPADWPMTREQYMILGYDTPEHALDSKELEKAGLHSRKEIVGFAYKVLEMDLSPIARDMISSSGIAAQMGAYELLGYYGSIEDAQKLFESVKAIDGKTARENLDGKQYLYWKMVESLGYYLMRDHLMPQKDRTLMQEIEDFLYRCSDIEQISCWDYESRPKVIDALTLHAIEAISLGSSERMHLRAKKYVTYPQDSIYHLYGSIELENLAWVEERAEKIKRQLPPMLPESEIDR